MDLVGLAINILWLLIGVIIILGIIWLALYVVKLFVPVPDLIEKAIWAVVLILILIATLTLLSGRGGTTFRWKSGVEFPTYAASPAVDHRAGTPIVR